MFNIAVVGCGHMSQAWIEYALTRSDCKIVALVDPCDANMQEKIEKYHLTTNCYSNLPDALAKEDINLVFDVTPPSIHDKVVISALEAGCDVFGEKPMSDSLEKAWKMVNTAERTGKCYAVMQNRRYLPHVVALKNFLNNKPLGDIGQISADFMLSPRFGGFREIMESPLIADMAIHTFDAARFILGKKPVAVYCHEFNPSWSWYKGNASAVCIFEFEDGSVFDYRGSWCAVGMNTSWESEWRIQCANGCIRWDGHNKLCYEGLNSISDTSRVTLDPITDIAPVEMSEQYHAGCLSEMFECLKKGVRPRTDCRDNIQSVEMVYQAINSARQKKRIML